MPKYQFQKVVPSGRNTSNVIEYIFVRWGESSSCARAISSNFCFKIEQDLCLIMEYPGAPSHDKKVNNN